MNVTMVGLIGNVKFLHKHIFIKISERHPTAMFSHMRPILSIISQIVRDDRKNTFG